VARASISSPLTLLRRRFGRTELAAAFARPFGRDAAGAVLGSAVSVALVTASIFGLREAVPVLSLGALYVVAVVAVAFLWGLAYAIPVSIASMLAFNWFFLEPVHTLALQKSEDWLVLTVYLATAVVVSELAARARRRAAEAEQRGREAALLASVARGLLESGSLQERLDRVAPEIAATLQLSSVRITLGAAPPEGEAETRLPLASGAGVLGTLVHPRAEAISATRTRRVLPALASLLAVAVEQDRLAKEAMEAEALRRSDSVKTAILRSVSHDFRSPLTAIRAAADSLASGRLELAGADRDELVATIRSEVRRLGALVENLLDLSRLEAGVARPAPAIWPVEELIGETLQELGERAARVRVSLPKRTTLLAVDAAQLERSLANLLDNALRLSPEGEIVELGVVRRGGRVEIAVQDRGPGLPPEDLERVFEPFFRSAERREGAGLGLAIVRGFVEANGGSVFARARAAGGASFTIVLPEATPASLLAGRQP
jgi:two-component system sensor histidine kinase KdpD